MIDYILKNNKLIEIIGLIPKMNKFINDIYNKLSLKISKNNLDKEIGNNLQGINLNSFNEVLKKIIEKLNLKEDINITEKSKYSDILNIKDNKIYRIYKAIIDEYNTFLEKTEIYEDNKEIMEEVVIQSSSENEYMIFQSDNKEKKKISAKERLKEILILCSNRSRIKEDDKINIYDGGKIEYNYDLIENILEDEFILGRKKFSKEQKTFIFSDKMFKADSNNLLLELNEKYEQVEIQNEIIQTISQKIVSDYNSKNNIIDFYYNLQYIIIYLMTYEKNNKYILSKTSISDIIKIIRKANYTMSDNFTSFIDGFSDSLFVNTLFSIYEIIELKAFQYLTEEIKIEKMEIEKESKNKIIKYFEDNKDKLLLNDEKLSNGFKKFILRYYLADADNNIKILDYITSHFEDIFNKIDIFGNKIINDERLKEEKKTIISINEKDNCIIKYYCNKLFHGGEEDNIIAPDNSFNNVDNNNDPFNNVDNNNDPFNNDDNNNDPFNNDDNNNDPFNNDDNNNDPFNNN